MQAARRYLLIALSFALAVTIIAIANPRVARAANSAIQSVLVTNTSANPVPTIPVGTTPISGNVGITGTTAVSGNVGITGTTNVAGTVGISGTPSVTVANSPSVSVNSLPAITGTVSLTPGTSVQDADNAARQPFQATVNLNINNFVFTNVPIPQGKRLVIDFITISGAATSSGGGIQPLALINSTVAGSNAVNFYFQPLQSTTSPSQFYLNTNVKIYADSLAIGPAFAGYTPDFLAENVTISGHLITP